MKRSYSITVLLSLALPLLVHASAFAREIEPTPAEILQFLALPNSNPNKIVGQSPLIIYATMKVVRNRTADEAQWYEVLKTLLRKRVSVDERDTNDYTALMYAAYYGHAESVLLLLSHNAQADFSNRYGNSPISVAYEGAKLATQKQKSEYDKIIKTLSAYAVMKETKRNDTRTRRS